VAKQEVNKLIAREDLVACLDRAAAGPVTIISAPAGSGKTSLLRAWSDAIRHTQAAGDWPDAARLLADHSFDLTMNGEAPAVRTLLRAFPRGAHYPELALVRAGRSLAQGRLDEAAAHLSAAEQHAERTTTDRQPRLGIAISSLRLSLAARRGHPAERRPPSRLRITGIR
jgi:ATP/maltotriose-dependent transcriptional regulator MalT